MPFPPCKPLFCTGRVPFRGGMLPAARPACSPFRAAPAAGGRWLHQGQNTTPFGWPWPLPGRAVPGRRRSPEQMVLQLPPAVPAAPLPEVMETGTLLQAGGGGVAGGGSCRETLRPERPNAVSGTGSCDGASQLPGAESCRPRCFPAWVFALLTLSLEPSPPLPARGIPFLLSSSPLSACSIAFLGKGGLLLN